MTSKLLANPFIIYSISFLLVVILYPLGWSYLYPQLSPGLVIFLFVTIIVTLLVGSYFQTINSFSYRKVNYSSKKIWIATTVILVSYIVEFIYMRVIPVFAISTGAEYEYTSFGIPTFHVVLVTFNSFWAVFIYHNIVSKKSKALVVPYILCLLPSILIFNRGMFLLILASSLFVSIMAALNLRRLLLKISVFLIGILFLFGFAGNIRVSGGNSANDLILAIGNATEKFHKAPVPNEFFWAYLYITSPLANLQQTIDNHHISPTSLVKIAVFVNSEIFPDFISKRNKTLFKKIEAIDQISESFTVGTVYARSFSYFGWWGMGIMFLYILVFNIIAIVSLSRRSIFFVTGVAILNSIMLFNIFDNMFTFAGMVLQLTYPIILGAVAKLTIFSSRQKDEYVVESLTGDIK